MFVEKSVTPLPSEEVAAREKQLQAQETRLATEFTLTKARTHVLTPTNVEFRQARVIDEQKKIVTLLHSMVEFTGEILDPRDQEVKACYFTGNVSGDGSLFLSGSFSVETTTAEYGQIAVGQSLQLDPTTFVVYERLEGESPETFVCTLSIYKLEPRATAHSDSSPSETELRSPPSLLKSIARAQLNLNEPLPPVTDTILKVEDAVEELGRVPRWTLAIKPGELGGSPPHDHLYLSDDEVRAQLNQPDVPAKVSPLSEELERWHVYRERFMQADVLFLPGVGGIGDQIYISAWAAEFARQFPRKKIIFQTEHVFLYQVPQDLPNLKIIPPARKEYSLIKGFSDTKLIDELSGKNVFVFNINTATSVKTHALSPERLNQEGFVQEAYRLQSRFKIETNPPIVRPARPWLTALRQMLGGKSRITVFDEAGWKTDHYQLNLWNRWGQYVVPSSRSGLPARIATLKYGETDHPSKDKEARSVHQLDDQISKIHTLFGIEVGAEFENFPLVEHPIPAETQYDYFIVYDAKSALNKTFDRQTVHHLVAAIKNREPQARIAVVKGKDNPGTVDGLTELDSDVTIIEENFNKVIDLGLSSDRIITVDTGLGHFFDAVIERSRREQPQHRTPKLYSVFSSTSLFWVARFGLRTADTLLVQGTFDNCNPYVFLNFIDETETTNSATTES